MSASQSILRNPGIDGLKFLAAFGVVVLHIEPYSSIPTDFRSLMFLACRFAVPAFFLISGYFAAPTLLKSNLNIISFISRPIKYFTVGSLLYLPFQLGRVGPEGIWTSIKTLNVLISGTCFHLWFLSSLIFAYIIIVFFLKTGSETLLLMLSILLTLSYALGNYFPSTSENQLEFYRYLSSIPLIYTGIILRKVAADNYSRRQRLSIIILGIIISASEAYIISKNGGDFGRVQFSIGIFIFSIGIFMASLSFIPHSSLLWICGLGAIYSPWIYITHVWFLALVKKTYVYLGWIDTMWGSLAMAPVAFSLTLIFLMCCRQGSRLLTPKALF